MALVFLLPFLIWFTEFQNNLFTFPRSKYVVHYLSIDFMKLVRISLKLLFFQESLHTQFPHIRWTTDANFNFDGRSEGTVPLCTICVIVTDRTIFRIAWSL